MKAHRASVDTKCWKQFTQLANLADESPTEVLAQQMGIPRAQLTKLMVSLQEAKAYLEAETGQSEEVFQVWNWAEWCQMVHAMEELIRDNSDTTIHALLLPFLKQCRQHPAYTVYVKLRQEWETSSAQAPSWPGVEVVEEAIFSSYGLHYDHHGRAKVLVPRKLVHLEGALTVIGEEVHDHGLVAVPLAEMTEIEIMPQKRELRAHIVEVEEFIHALRAMGENETRLVLKIKDPSRFTLLPDYHYLGKPCLVTNAQGELIWAAYVEPCADLYEWLQSLEDQVEILDPVDFLADYRAYCARKTA